MPLDSLTISSSDIKHIAMNLIALSDEIYEILSCSKNSVSIFPNDTPPTYTEWLPLYYSHRKIKSVVISYLREAINSSGITPELHEAFTENNLQKTADVISTSDVEIDPNSDLAGYVYRHEVSFFFKVVVPCFIFYKESPFLLYSQARKGDLDSLNKVLRIDKAIICDPRIANHFYQASTKENKLVFDNLITALDGAPKQRITRQRVKYIFAAIISITSHLFGTKLSAPEIKEIFDLYSRESNSSQQIDPHLPDSEEAFAKAIQRERPFWESLISTV